MAEAEIREQARQDKVFLAYAPDDEEDLASPSPEEIEAQMEAIKSRCKPEDYERRRRYRPPPIVDEELCRPRLCVSCNQLFTSYGPGNRRCESCILATADLEGDHERERIRRCGGYGSICFDGEGDDIGD
jgi:hypothetical protein